MDTTVCTTLKPLREDYRLLDITKRNDTNISIGLK